MNRSEEPLDLNRLRDDIKQEKRALGTEPQRLSEEEREELEDDELKQGQHPSLGAVRAKAREIARQKQDQPGAETQA
jgi:hypothetical protein